MLSYPFLCLAPRCTVLRCRWCQSGINTILLAELHVPLVVVEDPRQRPRYRIHKEEYLSVIKEFLD
jgi:hypothetical protein